MKVARSFESEVEFKAVEPWDGWVDALGLKFFGQVLVVFSESVAVRSVIISDHDGIAADANIAI